MSEPRNARSIAIGSNLVVRQQTAWMFVNEIMLDNLSFSSIDDGEPGLRLSRLSPQFVSERWCSTADVCGRTHLCLTCGFFCCFTDDVGGHDADHTHICNWEMHQNEGRDFE